ncbi:hypothetical protein CHLNCDRAFT_142999 [Chlorella variabilis]|uniref:Fumarylacetoacetase n=1 Tax=Chlorella variabilis TaxID=554065 RepID=E1Z995_CHLVA|nr:hypothetical protein CHLNCDRAFT_142999 [Chlorella variabilis]EFN57479.1 hypothetical protein CHLNCDRAFT_142999 [Chlorella variabilis]|eukprot:XP_005849581.1 hypothetical protein CHLNCDRAFT_142999 [Chlorella variabilis]
MSGWMAAASSSWVAVDPSSHFSLHNLPYGIFSTAANPTPRPGVAIGDNVLDLSAVAQAGLFSGPVLSSSSQCFQQPTLNSFMSLGRPAWLEARHTVQRLLLHLPVGYHGRASSVVVSGTDVRRPWGQVQQAAGQAPAFLPSSQLDFELEMGCFIGTGNELGSAIPAAQAAHHIFGWVLANDWSARDIQRWEYVPLGPFNSKNFGTSISPWVVTPQALEPFARPAPPQHDPAPLPYLQQPQRSNYDVALEVAVQPAGGCAGETVVARSNLRTLYWTMPQMIAHHTAGGCNLRPGDMLATGTLSCEGPLGAGCLLEATWNGSRPVELSDGSKRTYLEDGDTVVMRGCCQGDGYRVGFGECRGTVLPARPL